MRICVIATILYRISRGFKFDTQHPNPYTLPRESATGFSISDRLAAAHAAVFVIARRRLPPFQARESVGNVSDVKREEVPEMDTQPLRLTSLSHGAG